MKKQIPDIYNTITQKLLCRFAADGDRNIVLSPLSVLVLLGMLADATGSGTREEIAKALGYGDHAEEFIEWLAAAQRDLMESGALISSNAVCIREELKDRIAPGYEEHLRQVFDGRLFTAKAMANAVNEWVNEKTKGMIPQIADESVNAALACLMNAIAFEAKWDQKYESDDIEPGEFNNSDGSCNEVTMMRSNERHYIEDAHFTGFTKPYKEAGYSFMALLPKKEDPAYLRRALEQVNLTKLFHGRKTEKVLTFIPEYTLESGGELKEFSESLGIRQVFTGDADFSPMTDAWLKVQRIIHKAKIRVDRNGTKAVAATIAVMYAGCVPDFDYRIVELDRPFVFAIVHDDTGLPVFAGVVNHLED